MGRVSLKSPLRVRDLIDAVAEAYGSIEVVSRPAVGPVQRTRWGTLATRVRRVAGLLVSLGVRPGDRVCTLAWNHERHVELYFAVPAVGAVLTPLHPRHPIEQLIAEAARSVDALLFYDPTFEHLVDKIESTGVTRLRRCVPLTESDFDTLLSDQPPMRPWPTLEATEAEHAAIEHAMVLADAAGGRIRDQEVILLAEPMSLSSTRGVLYAAALRGAKLVLPGFALDVQSLFTLMEQERATLLVGPEPHWAHLLRHLRSVGAKLSTVRTVWIGDETLQTWFVDAWGVHGVRVIH